MSLLPYNSTGWLTHRERQLREIDFPLFEGDSTHFTVERFYIGPRETYVPIALNTVDAVYNGVAASVTGTAATDLVDFASAKKFLTGDPVTLAVTTGLAGLTAGVYYLIRISDTSFKLASTRANAIAGTAIDITSDGTGTLTPPPAYLVNQSKLRDADADQWRYERLFSTLPAQWSDEESYTYTFPAYAAGSSSSNNVNAITASGSNTIFSLATSGAAVAGDSVFVNVTYTRNGVVQSQTLSATAVATTNTSQVTIPFSFPGSGAFTSVSGTVAKVQPGVATPQTLVGGSRLQYDYALTATATINADLPIISPFKPVDSAYATVDTLTASTLPTASAYRTMVQNSVEIVAECSRKRYLGNIFVRITRYVVAK